MRHFTVRLAHVGEGIAITYHDVPAADADEAAAKALAKAEKECATTGFVLDGPVEEQEPEPEKGRERFSVWSVVGEVGVREDETVLIPVDDGEPLLSEVLDEFDLIDPIHEGSVVLAGVGTEVV